MSRGPGRVQAAIVTLLKEQPCPCSFEEMRWAVYNRLGEPPLPANGKLPTKWNTSFGRALTSLEQRTPKIVSLERRRLASLEECVRHYPGKTLQVDVYRLRTALLPVLRDWAEDRESGPRYTRADNERFYLKGLSPEDVTSLRRLWNAIEPKLISCLETLPLEQRNTLFLCIAKGKSLFEEMILKSRRSFVELANECDKARILPKNTADLLSTLCETFLAAPIAGFLRLKSYVHTFADVSKHRRYMLKEETLEQLYRLKPAVLEALPGFKHAPERRSRSSIDLTVPTHSKRIHSLIDQTVFQEFVFASLRT